ncbi:hypothetical protein JOF53_000859 [Crossiella equi]|uniref:Uncharacterized protein n=1 Tax=Crossiella equi TaxID=130796 RepID=A0ABS5A6U8_9PSEU|nr:hypothetical protein [Crossiella equi]MBP2471987.1 hypothetical protein [Crossiella equi]
MKTALGRIAATAVIAATLMGGAVGTASALGRDLQGTFGTEAQCENAALAWRSADVGAECQFVERQYPHSSYWNLWVWSIGG